MLCAVAAFVFSEPAHVEEAWSGEWQGRADSLAAEARAAAHANDNIRAAALFGVAMRYEPARRGEWLREYADQLTYSGNAVIAVPLYREALESVAGESIEEERRTRLGLALALSWAGDFDAARREYELWLEDFPYDAEAQLGRARVLSWMNQNAAAERAYASVVWGAPANLEAQRNFARVQSWRSRNRAAQRRLAEQVRLYPEDVEARFLLAQSQTWLGRPDQAMRNLDHVLERQPNHINALQMQDDLRQQLRPSAALRYEEARQSDDLVIRTLHMEGGWTFNTGLSRLGPRFVVQHLDPETGDASTTTGLGAQWRHRFHDALAWSGWASLDRLDVVDDEHLQWTYDTWVTFWPHDALRFDVGSNRTTLDNLPSLRHNIVATYANLGVDVVPNELWRLVTRFNWGNYSDGNQRSWGQLVVERRLLSNPRIVAGITSTAFRFDEQLQSGYFNPSRYVANGATLRIFNVSGKRAWFDVSGMAGAEHSSPPDDHFIWSAAAQFRIAITRGSTLSLHASHYSSATASSSGFARSTYGVTWNTPLY